MALPVRKTLGDRGVLIDEAGRVVQLYIDEILQLLYLLHILQGDIRARIRSLNVDLFSLLLGNRDQLVQLDMNCADVSVPL